MPFGDAAGKFAGSLISGGLLQVGGAWNQCFAVAQRNLPAASFGKLSKRVSRAYQEAKANDLVQNLLSNLTLAGGTGMNRLPRLRDHIDFIRISLEAQAITNQIRHHHVAL